MRYYEINGDLYPSVTTALSIIRRPHLERWRGSLGNTEADHVLHEAGDIGTDVHKACEAINNGLTLGEAFGLVNTAATGVMVEAYFHWFINNIRDVIMSEQIVYNTTYRYAGRLDLLALVKGDKLPSIIDVKTGNSFPETPLQLAAYQKPIEESGIKTGRRLVVHLNKKEPGKLRVVEYAASEADKDFRTFLYALELYRYFNPSPKQGEIIKIGGVKNDQHATCS